MFCSIRHSIQANHTHTCPQTFDHMIREVPKLLTVLCFLTSASPVASRLHCSRQQAPGPLWCSWCPSPTNEDPEWARDRKGSPSQRTSSQGKICTHTHVNELIIIVLWNDFSTDSLIILILLNRLGKNYIVKKQSNIQAEILLVIICQHTRVDAGAFFHFWDVTFMTAVVSSLVCVYSICMVVGQTCD